MFYGNMHENNLSNHEPSIKQIGKTNTSTCNWFKTQLNIESCQKII